MTTKYLLTIHSISIFDEDTLKILIEEALSKRIRIDVDVQKVMHTSVDLDKDALKLAFTG